MSVRSWHAAAVNIWETEGRRFEVVMASDVVRDGMALELTDLDGDAGAGPALEIFWSHSDRTFEFLAHQPVRLPLAVLTRFVDAAVSRLPPGT